MNANLGAALKSPVSFVAERHDEFTAIRRDLHAHPEPGFQEHRTAALVAERLHQWGIEVHTGAGKTGVVGVVRGRKDGSGKAVGLRADMDALPMQEDNDFAHRSTRPGLMHGCGHDGHTTMRLAAARAFGGEARVRYERIYPATINHAPQYEFAVKVAEELVGRERVARNLPPSMGAEDFAFTLHAKPGCYIRLGQGPAAGSTGRAGRAAPGRWRRRAERAPQPAAAKQGRSMKRTTRRRQP